MTNEHLEFLRSRYSVRKFTNQPVPKELLERLLETATWAPSAHNRQPWRMVVLESQEMRDRLGAAMGAQLEQALVDEGVDADAAQARVELSRQRISQAPLGILLCVDEEAVPTQPDIERQSREYQMAVQSTALAGGTLLLAAHAEGLEGVWLCAPLFQSKVVRQTLDLPDTWHPQGLLLIGYPDEPPQPRNRRPWQEVTVYR